MTILRSKQAAIFDIDGTLVDTRDTHLRVWAQVLAEAGIEVTRERLQGLFGKHSDEWVKELVPPERQSKGPAIVRRKNQVFAARLDDLRPFPKARELLRAVKGAGILIAFATGATKSEMEHHIRLLDAEELVAATAYDREVPFGKPAPDIYALAVRKLGVEPAAAVAIGDSLYDVQSARAAGMECIALLTGGFGEAELRAAGAAEVYPAVAELYDAFAPGTQRGGFDGRRD
jgi:HAD superfamily hydrolase (TIGR01509 family)